MSENEVTTSVAADGTEEVSLDVAAESNRVSTINFGRVLRVSVFVNDEGVPTVLVDTLGGEEDSRGPTDLAVVLNEGDLYRN